MRDGSGVVVDDDDSGVARNFRHGVRKYIFLDFVRPFLDPNISNCRWPSISFPAVSSFGDCSHA